MKNVVYEMVTVTPTYAKKLLDEKNHGNRKLRVEYAKKLAYEMIENRWVEGTGVPIILDETGNVIDGQHRLYAVITANKPIRFTIAKNVNRDAQDVIDTGLNRQASDVLSFAGVKNSNAIASIIRFFLTNGLNKNSSKNSSGVTNIVVKNEYLKDPDFWQNITMKSQTYYRQFRALQKTVFGGCMALALKESNFPQKVHSFFDELASGETTSLAVLDLRKKIINNQISNKKLTAAAKRDLIKFYFNGYVKDQKNGYNHPDGVWL